MTFVPTVNEHITDEPKKDLSQTILREMQKMIEVREDYEVGLWEPIGRFLNIRREDIRGDRKDERKGKKFGGSVYDGTPISALNTWADGMQGFLVSESLTWFRTELDDPFLNDNDEIREFLQEYDRAMYSAFRRGNLYSVLGEYFRDAGSIGTATIFTEEDVSRGASAHVVVHPREIFINENKFGEVDTVYRRFKMTARQAVQRFGFENVSDKIQTDAKNSPNESPFKQHEFIHAVFPNTDRHVGKVNSTNKIFRSVYMEAQTSGANTGSGIAHVTSDSGFDFNPYAVWRFSKMSDELYGRSPAADALTEIISLNQLGKTMLEAAQKSVQPPLNIPGEMRGRVRMTPDGHNYYEDPARIIKPINSGVNYPIGIDQQERLQKVLEDKYRVQFFLSLQRSTREMTATEIIARQSEQAVLMGPQTDRLFDEGIKRIFDIVAFIEERAGRLPTPPDALVAEVEKRQERKQTPLGINLNLTGPLAQAQKRLFVIAPIQNTINELAPLAAIKPEVLDVIDFDELSEIIVEAGSFPQKAINSKDRRQEIRDKRELAQQQAQAQQQLQAMAEQVPNLSKTPEPGSPAEAIGEAI
ncbi:MAG: head-tail connector protein [Candidatus Peribacteraceae bacterium]|nr:head-tail connector protein [Candidatus Peribacteraceae bacterium]